MSRLIPKTIGNRKRDCAWGCTRGINTTWEHLQIEKHKSVRWAERTFLICAFQSADFLRWCLSPERNLTHNLSFYFQQFLVLIWFIFSMRRRAVQPDRLFCCFDPLSRHLTVRILRSWRMRTVSKSATFLATETSESVNLAPIKRGETKVQSFGKEGAKLFAN